FVHVNYYSRPQPNRSSPIYRGNTNQRSRIIDAPRGDDRRPNIGRSTPPGSQEHVAIPRSSAVNRDTFPTRQSTTQADRPSGSTNSRQSDDRVFGSRQVPQAVPRE